MRGWPLSKWRDPGEHADRSRFIVNESGVQLASAEINGESVTDGQRVRLTLSSRETTSYRKGKLTVQAANIQLVVSCFDAAGNVASATAYPVY